MIYDGIIIWFLNLFCVFYPLALDHTTGWMKIIKSQILRYPIYPSLEKSFFLPLKMEGQQKITLISPLKISSVPKPFFRYFEENGYVHCTCTCTVYSCRTQMDL